jgi:hypothetical protein
MVELVVVMVDACNEAEAQELSCKSAGKLRVPRRPGEESREAGGGKTAHGFSTSAMDSRGSRQRGRMGREAAVQRCSSRAGVGTGWPQ